MSEFILPPPLLPPNKRFSLVPVSKELQGQAALILKDTALALLKPKFFVIDVNKAEIEQSVNQPGVGGDSYDKKSVFGLPVFDTITLNALTYTDFNGQQINVANFTLDIALVEVSNPRNIIRTPITGRNGTVKEYMSDGDYDITIRGSLVTNYMNIPPEAMVRSLNAFCKAQTEIKVNSTVLSYLDIFSIVIVEPKFIQRQGARNAIDYELRCVSETPFELKDA